MNNPQLNPPMGDLKYLAAFSIPMTAVLAISLLGPHSYLTPVFAFIFIPILEILLPQDTVNLKQSEVQSKSKKIIFDWMLYLNVPIVFGLLLFGLFSFTSKELETYEQIGLVLTVGIVMGVNGINVAHELGHRHGSNERFLGKALLLPSLYMHFYIEHNFGHHLHAATEEDPATARYNQSLYSFWLTSVTRQYISAWNLQARLLAFQKKPFLSVKNDMIWYLLFQLIYLLIITFGFGLNGLLFSILVAIVSFLLLETVNYIEHYGLLRLKTKHGRYERVKEIHSWNSNHVVGRIVLYELTRHSDHHFKSTKKYQILDCHDNSPQMPFGYPTSMVLSMLPPLWFKIMNHRIPEQMNN